MPGCLGVASDLVQCDSLYRGVIENLLGRTVVADNMDHGIAIMRRGRQAFRLVTLQGDVMHSGGSMTGGSVSSRNVNLFSRERELKELTEKLTAGQEELEAPAEGHAGRAGGKGPAEGEIRRSPGSAASAGDRGGAGNRAAAERRGGAGQPRACGCGRRKRPGSS